LTDKGEKKEKELMCIILSGVRGNSDIRALIRRKLLRENIFGLLACRL